MTHVAEHAVAGPAIRSFTPPRRRLPAHRQSPPRCSDPRWPALAAALTAMREARRCSVRIIDADCGTGTMLVRAARHARALGFTAIEAHGIANAPAMVARARAAAKGVRDPAIGFSFASGDMVGALEREADFPADIIIWRGGQACGTATARVVAAAGRTLIADVAIIQDLAA